ncbi:glycosyltransferase [Ectothiorhodospira variabilis]|uniref:glycosyltransferase n=1 Tax=Ectothiorhodospira variabilis TaxID=505694 RepID=UPI001EFA8F24|nr:glycosyltransferase [Ectothiorhodospira variabilis]MCG5494767.1 glycosyltransferase [Ectothiorhodospira variabilis]MCG5504344.1 glycosyltransferase [Ectothiorhodospira variabilis]MCG5507499.1 glycosyltransferase [Ectothiorhodospira variabilis]
MEDRRPHLVVYTHVFPNQVQPTYGVFVRERMFRVAKDLPVTVVAPVPWFPGQALLRRLRAHYRPEPPYHEVQQGIDVYHPRFLSIPRFFKFTDGLFEALFTWPLMRRLKREGRLDLIDAHFVHPDGVAAWLLGSWLRVPHTITLRGTILRISKTRLRRWLATRAMKQAARVFSVADSLRQTAITMGVSPNHVQVVSNGINLEFFQPEDRQACRQRLGIPVDAQVLITVGTLNERKGFHRVIEQMPTLLQRYPNLLYLAVGGENPDGDKQRLLDLAASLGVEDRVIFAGQQPPEALRHYYCAADLFVLPTRFEGWANVFLEAAACGLPTVTTRVGGNAEVISSPTLGRLVPLGDGEALREAITTALEEPWDHEAIIAHARANAWEQRIPELLIAFDALTTAQTRREEAGT